MSTSETTTDRDTIISWVEERGGRPAVVKDTRAGESSGLLRIDFGDAEESLEEISWDEFFEAFDHNNLAFLYSPEKENRFNKFVAR